MSGATSSIFGELENNLGRRGKEIGRDSGRFASLE